MISLSEQDLDKICESLADKAMFDVEAYELFNKIVYSRNQPILNEEIQVLDKVKLNKETGFVTGEIDGKMIVMVQGNTYLVDPKELKEYNKKAEPTLVPPMKFDEKTQKLLFEQWVKCGVFHGNVPIKMSDCYVRYNLWEAANAEQQVKVIIEGNPTFMPKSQVKILEDINSFANEENYIPGVIIDETTEEVIENILLHAIDYANAVGDADSVRIIKQTPTGEQEMQTMPRATLRTMTV